MNDDLSIRPAYLDQLGPEDAFSDIHGFVRPPRVSMLNDRFNPLDENGEPALPPSLQLQVIMLQENDTRIYYPAGEYEPDSAVPPSCFSDNKIVPSENAVDQQHPTCAGCPRAVRDIPSFNGKSTVSACKERYKVACLVAGAKGKVFLLDIGPASRRAYGAYFNFLKQHHARANQVITTLGYADKAFSFTPAGWINPATAEMVRQTYETDEPAMVVSAFDRSPPLAIGAPLKKYEQGIEWGERATGTKEIQTTETSVVQDPPKRRGRPPKEPNAQMSSPNLSGQAPASFAEPPTPQTSAPAPKPSNGGGFGMEVAKSPPEDLQAALNRAFAK